MERQKAICGCGGLFSLKHVFLMKVMTLGSPKGYGSQNKPCALNHPPASSCLLWIGGIPGASVPHRNRGSGSAIDFAALRRGMAMAN